MLLKLSLLLSTIGIIACNVPFDTTKEVKYEETSQIHQRNYQHSEYLNSYTEVFYKYETNEVNSIDDLIPGNIYEFDLDGNVIDDILVPDESILFKVLTPLSFNGVLDIYDSDGDFPYFSDIVLQFGYYSDPSLYIYFSYDQFIDYSFSIEAIMTGVFTSNCVIQYLEGPISNYQFLSSTDYNEIESVIYHQPQTVIGVINEFCETYLFSEIPYINSMTFEVGGQSINLMTWLVMAVGLVIGIGILIALFYIFKWLILLFAGIFKK